MSYLSLCCFSFENEKENCGQVPSCSVIALRNIWFFLLNCVGGLPCFVLTSCQPGRDAMKKLRSHCDRLCQPTIVLHGDIFLYIMLLYNILKILVGKKIPAKVLTSFIVSKHSFGIEGMAVVKHLFMMNSVASKQSEKNRRSD